MAVRSVELREFSAFADVTLPCVDGLNVFIGENGTGKSHAMKAVYAVLESMRAFKLDPKGPALPQLLEAKLGGVFRPSGEISRLIRRKHGQNASYISVDSARGSSFKATLSVRGGLKVTKPWGPYRSVFLPSREVLALYPGFTSLYLDREISFDETYYDACLALGRVGLRGPRRAAAEDLAARLRRALGGHTELKGDEFYVKFDGDRARMEAHLVAEGLRKIATLERLVLNGTLSQNSYLFWDEPEANLNPKLTTVIADVLCRLATNRTQVFLTTHDYLLLKELDLLTARKQTPPTRFFVFQRARPGAPVEVAHADRLEDLPSNPISEEFIRLYERKLDSEAEDDS